MWSSRSLPLEASQLRKLTFAPDLAGRPETAAAFTPTFFKGSLDVDGPPADTYLQTRGWGKGSVWSVFPLSFSSVRLELTLTAIY